MADQLSSLDVIEKRGDKYVVLSKTGEVLGTHETEAAALVQLRAIEASKADDRGLKPEFTEGAVHKDETKDSLPPRERVFRTDVAPITKAERDAWGFMHVHATVSAPGVFPYIRDGKVRRELKDPAELFASSHLASIDGAVVTDEHPANRIPVTPENIQQLSAGHGNGKPEVTPDGINVKLKVTDDTLIHSIETRKKTSVSLGMLMEFDPSPGVWIAPDGTQHAYDGVQRQMITNHIAVTKTGRVPTAQLHLDSQDHELLEPEENIMPEQLAPLTIDGATLQVSSTTASVVQAALARHETKLNDLQTCLDQSVATHDSVVTERDKAVAERDALKAERDVALEKLKVADALDVDALVQERIDFCERAKSILPEDKYKEVSSKSNMEIMRFACDSLTTGINVADQSDDYVRAWFNITCDTQAKGNNDRFAATVANTPVSPSEVSHRKSLNERMAAARVKADGAHRQPVNGAVHS